MIIILIILLYSLIVILELPPLLRKKDKKGLYVNLFLTFLSFAVAVLMALNYHFPSPSDVARIITESISGK